MNTERLGESQRLDLLVMQQLLSGCRLCLPIGLVCSSHPAKALHTARAVVVIPGLAEHPEHEVFVRSDVHTAAIPAATGAGFGFLRFGLSPAIGGPSPAASGTSATDLLLQSTAACAGTTMRAVAVSMGLSFDRLLLTVELAYDERGTMAVERSVPVGARTLSLHLDIVTAHSLASGQIHPAKDWERLLAASERYCVVAQSLISGLTGVGEQDPPEALPARPPSPAAVTSSYQVWHDADAARGMMRVRLGDDVDALPLPEL